MYEPSSIVPKLNIGIEDILVGSSKGGIFDDMTLVGRRVAAVERSVYCINVDTIIIIFKYQLSPWSHTPGTFAGC